MRRSPVALAVTVLTAAVLAACGGSSQHALTTTTSAPATTTSTHDPNATFPVQHVTITFVDDARPTDDPSDRRSAPSRTLPTEVYIPEGPGPFPLIVHAHGSSGDPSKFSDLLTSWATHGYVVAAPTFPLTNDTTGGPTVDRDYVNQPADVRFVIDQLLGEAATHGTDLTGKIDARHIGVSGLSLGGTTVYGLLYNACCRDDRIRAAIVMSGIQLPFGSRPFTYRSVPLLIFHGTADTTIPYAAAVGQYASAVAPKYFVSLIGGRHSPPYENTPDVHDDVVMRVTLDFWNAYLRDDHAALLRIATDANVPRLSSIRFDR